MDNRPLTGDQRKWTKEQWREHTKRTYPVIWLYPGFHTDTKDTKPIMFKQVMVERWPEKLGDVIEFTYTEDTSDLRHKVRSTLPWVYSEEEREGVKQ